MSKNVSLWIDNVCNIRLSFFTGSYTVCSRCRIEWGWALSWRFINLSAILYWSSLIIIIHWSSGKTNRAFIPCSFYVFTVYWPHRRLGVFSAKFQGSPLHFFIEKKRADGRNFGLPGTSFSLQFRILWCGNFPQLAFLKRQSLDIILKRTE